MELSIKDRLFFPHLLPQCKSFLEFHLKRNILNKVAITDDDRKKYEIVADKESGSVRWNPKTDTENPCQVDFSKEELAFIKRGCETLADVAYPDEFWHTVEKVWNTANE